MNKTVKFIAKEAAELLGFMIGTTALVVYFDRKARQLKEAKTNE